MNEADFMFIRNWSVEEAYGVTLVGVLVTNIPGHEDLREDDRERIFEVIERLTGMARRDPDWSKASIWRQGAMPLGGDDELFPDAVRRAQANGCVVVRVFGDGFCRIDEVELAEIMGRYESAWRLN
jgi:hypothetical protein